MCVYMWENTSLLNFHPTKCEILSHGIQIKLNPSTMSMPMSDMVHGHKLSLAIDHIPKWKQEKLRQSQRATNLAERLRNIAKHLRVNINSKLSRNHHVIYMSQGKEIAPSPFWYVTRATATDQSRHTVNKPMYVRPTLQEYASTVWDPTSKLNINKLVVMVQRRAARYVYSDWRHCGGPRFDQSRIRLNAYRACAMIAFICYDALWRSGNGIRHARAEIRLNNTTRSSEWKCSHQLIHFYLRCSW